MTALLLLSLILYPMFSRKSPERYSGGHRKGS